jgi:hypothetical protein
MKLIWSCFALALGLPFGALSAQETSPLAPGARVRVTANPAGGSVVGSLETIDSSTIVVRRNNGTTVAFPRERVTQLDVSGGPGACSGGGRVGCVALGLLGGATLGLLAVVVAVPNASDPSRLSAVFTVPAGAVLGTLVGAVVGGEHWNETEVPARLSVAPDASGRLSFGLSVRF